MFLSFPSRKYDPANIRVRIIRTFVSKFKTDLQIETLILKSSYSSPTTLRQIPAFFLKNT